MRRVAVMFIFFLSAYSVASAALSSRHVYMNGQVDSLSQKTITVSGVTYNLHKPKESVPPAERGSARGSRLFGLHSDDTAPVLKVIIQTMEKGAIFEKPGSLSDVHTGDWVTVKVSGNVVDEIILERWKR